MKQDRFLAGILVGIVALVITSILMFAVRQNRAAYLPDDSPEAAAHNYVLAIQKGDYERAYSYLAEAPNKPDLVLFRQSFTSGQLSLNNVSIEIGQADTGASLVSLPVTIIRNNNGLFSQMYRESTIATLELSDGGWKIRSFAYPYWGWDWYQIPPVKTAP